MVATLTPDSRMHFRRQSRSRRLRQAVANSVRSCGSRWRQLAGKLKVVSQNPATQARFQVQGISTLLLFRDGALVERLVGARPKAALAQAVQAHL